MFQRHILLASSGQFPEDRGRIFFQNVNNWHGVTPEDHTGRRRQQNAGQKKCNLYVERIMKVRIHTHNISHLLQHN
jgi:hypothetical protein